MLGYHQVDDVARDYTNKNKDNQGGKNKRGDKGQQPSDKICTHVTLREFTPGIEPALYLIRGRG
jgi:hypothetical protein